MGGLFAVGQLLFCGSLYALGVTENRAARVRKLGPVGATALAGQYAPAGHTTAALSCATGQYWPAAHVLNVLAAAGQNWPTVHAELAASDEPFGQ